MADPLRGERSRKHGRRREAVLIRVVLIGFAGALGTVTRYGVGLWAGRVLGAAFPYGTLIVNVVGCFLIALVSQLALSTTLISPTLRLTLTTGFMGGLTTYSSFNFETTNLLRERGLAEGFTNVAVTLVSCFVAGLLGLALARTLAGAK
jgi:fluoride exporter